MSQNSDIATEVANLELAISLFWPKIEPITSKFYYVSYHKKVVRPFVCFKISLTTKGCLGPKRVHLITMLGLPDKNLAMKGMDLDRLDITCYLKLICARNHHLENLCNLTIMPSKRNDVGTFLLLYIIAENRAHQFD